MGRKARRCEPCSHQKRECSKCKRTICIYDFSYRKDKEVYRRQCMDCMNKIWINCTSHRIETKPED
jgi:hypothetical protein